MNLIYSISIRPNYVYNLHSTNSINKSILKRLYSVQHLCFLDCNKTTPIPEPISTLFYIYTI